MWLGRKGAAAMGPGRNSDGFKAVTIGADGEPTVLVELTGIYQHAAGAWTLRAPDQGRYETSWAQQVRLLDLARLESEWILSATEDAGVIVWDTVTQQSWRIALPQRGAR